MTPAQILRETIKKDGKPERQLKQYEAMGFVYGTPVSKFLEAALPLINSGLHLFSRRTPRAECPISQPKTRL